MNPEISSLGSSSTDRKSLGVKKKNGDPLLCVQRRKVSALSPELVLETAVCKRASEVAWFSCVGASLTPRRWPTQTTSPANCTREMTGRQKAQSDSAALPKITEGKPSRTSISIHEPLM